MGAGTAVIWFGAHTAAAQALSGFAEVRGAAYTGVDGTPWEAIERIRPTFEAGSETVVFATTVEAALHQGRDVEDELLRTIDDAGLTEMAEAAGIELPEEHANEVLRIDEPSDYLSVERLYVDTYLKVVDLRVGRQALNWGSARFLNPTSPFPELLVTEPWRFQHGVNAVRATVPIKERHQLQAVLGADDLFQSVRAAGRGTLNVGTTDVSLSGAYRGDADNGIVGLDVRGTLGVGFWFEGSAHFQQAEEDEPTTKAGEPYEELAAGVDYSLPLLQRFLLMAQYYRNGSGVTSRDDYDWSARMSMESDGDPFAPPLMGQDYLMSGAMVSVIEELSVNLSGLHNLDDGTGMVIPTVSVLPTGWLDVTATAQIPYRVGPGGEFSPRDEDLVFGEAPFTLDLGGLVPSATFSLWVRASL